MKDLGLTKMARQAVCSAIADSVDHLYVILLSEVSRTDTGDVIFAQISNLYFGSGRYVRPIDSLS
jgi:hypothetical protein